MQGDGGQFYKGFWTGLGVMAAIVAAGLVLRVVRI